LWYVKEALGKVSYYHPSSHLDIVGYSNTDWVDDPIDRRSTLVIALLLDAIW